MSSPNTLKRTFAETRFEDSTRPQDLSSTLQAAVTPCSSAGTYGNAHGPPLNQALQTSQVSSSPPMPDDSAPSTAAATSGDPFIAPQPPAKRVKLTFAEKEARRVEKELKDRQKAEEKAKKDEGKAHREAKREEERRFKEAEKEEKLRAREEEKKMKLEEQLLKEEERNRREQEKIKKARSQPRINSFFPQPSGVHCARSGSPTRDEPSPMSSRRSSVSETSAREEERRSRSVSKTPRKTVLPDYERSFPPFFVKVHTVLAPSNRFLRDTEGSSAAQKRIDKILQEVYNGNQPKGLTAAFNCYQLSHVFPHNSHRRPPRIYSVRDIIAEIDGAARNPIDLTESQSATATKKPLELLRLIPLKYLKFREDVRPPYTGTYTRLRDGQAIAKLARNPFSRILPKTDYDFDSEAEWEEPGEGEDLDSEGEEEADDEDEAEMNDFLDDAEALDVRVLKRRPLLGDLEPTCSGLCWEGPQSNVPGFETIDLLMFRLDILMSRAPYHMEMYHADFTDNPQLPIDPYTTTYWETTTAKSSSYASSNPHRNPMEPPRIPLKPMNRQNTKLSPLAKEQASEPSGNVKPPKGPKRFLPPEIMNEFKTAVQGNDLTKVGMLEILKKQFPTQPKDAIKETLELVAERVGPNSKEKKWVLRSGWQS